MYFWYLTNVLNELKVYLRFIYSQAHQMTNLVSFNLENGNVLTSSLIIADQVDNQHKSVIQLIRQNLVDLEEFGRVAFEMSPFETDGGTQNREIAFLNEQQATLLITYMRNNDVVRKFKKRLVKAFYEARINLTPAEILLCNAQRLVDQEREQARLAARQTELEKSQYEIKQQVKAIIEGENYYTVVGVCNIYGIKVDKPLSSKIGKEASKICKANNWKIGTAPSVEFGRINSYPKEAIEEAMTILGLLMDVCEHKSDNRH